MFPLRSRAPGTGHSRDRFTAARNFARHLIIGLVCCADLLQIARGAASPRISGGPVPARPTPASAIQQYKALNPDTLQPSQRQGAETRNGSPEDGPLTFTIRAQGSSESTLTSGSGGVDSIVMNFDSTLSYQPYSYPCNGRLFLSQDGLVEGAVQYWGSATDHAHNTYNFSNRDFAVRFTLSGDSESGFSPEPGAYLYLFADHDTAWPFHPKDQAYAFEYLADQGLMRVWIALRSPFLYDSSLEYYDFPATHTVTGQNSAPSCLFGTVTDPQGTALPGAQVVFGGVSRTTDAQGRFEYHGVPAANYSMTINKQGYPEWRNVENVPSFSILHRSYALPCCDARSAAQPVEIPFPSMWWPSSQFQHRLSRISAESGERLEVWWVVPPGREGGSHYELRHYSPGAGQELLDGIAIGACTFNQGVNDAQYVAVNVDGDSTPDCFLKTTWYNFDFGDEDQPADGSLDVRVFEYFVCQDLIVQKLRKHDFGCGGPPVSYPLTFQSPRCKEWLGPLKSELTEAVTPGHGSPRFRFALGQRALLDSSTDPFERLIDALVSQGISATNVAMGVIPIPIGDVDLSLSLGQGDYLTTVRAMGGCLGNSDYISLADVNGDGCVSLLDLQILFRDDSDEDGMIDWQEWITGTDPFERDSAFRLALSRPPGGKVILRWPSAAGRTYTLWRSSTLPWMRSAVETNISATPPFNIYEDQKATNQSWFYRLEVRLD